LTGVSQVEPVIVHHEAPVLFAKLLTSRFGPGVAGYRRAEVALGLPAIILANLAPKP
jgi:hypothetical protein